MSDSSGLDLKTAQAAFVRWFQGATSVGTDTALQLWCKVNSFLDANPAFSRIRVDAASETDLDTNFAEVERGILPYVKDLIAPVMGALATSMLFLALDLGAIPAAIAGLIVFCVLVFRNGGSLDGIQEWINGKLASFASFGS